MHQRLIGVGPARFRIVSDWESPLRALDALYADYPPVTDGYADFTVRLEAARPWRRFIRPSVHIRGDHMIADALPLPLSMALLAAEMGMNLQMALGWRRHVLLHAASVERDGRAVILSGTSGSGKSTLAAMLGEGDWRLMGDEFALVGLDTPDCIAFPRPVSLKNASIAAMTSRVDAARFGPLIAATPKGDIRHMVPRQDAIARMAAPARAALIIFPLFGSAASIRPMLPAETFVRLTDASTNYVALGEAGFDALTRLAADVPAFEITYPDGTAGQSLVRQLFDETSA
ncbi:MAG: hypothetical protein RLZZ58_1176 [Pseudomonadota bacterium]